ncbi:MAG: TauD/TfdA family dioxygenase [Patescibacteria group bacterium]
MEKFEVWNRNQIASSPEKINLSISLSPEELEAISHLPIGDIDEKVRSSIKFQSFAQAVIQRLNEGTRFCLAEGLAFEEFENSPELMQAYMVAISNLIGVTTCTDRVKKNIVWPIKADPTQTGDNLTYSEHQGHAGLHTDTQYFPEPESGVSLWCLNPDKNGEGESILVDARMAIHELIARGLRDSVEILSREKVPFRVPTAFTATATEDSLEIFSAPIIGESPYIRYRRETIERAYTMNPKEKDQSIAQAMDHLDEVLNDPSLQIRFNLRRGQVLFLNNHEILHGRTSFSDLERHLLRIRFNIH